MKHKWYVMAAIAALTPAAAQAGNFCGELRNAFGPFDYRLRAQFPAEINIVEHAHFTADVENGIRGVSSGIGGDLDYTLRAWPNHHRALAATARYAVRTKQIKLPYGNYPVECYFDRAMRFAPDDGAVRAEYANYLYALGKTERAFVLYRQAVAMSPENATINYNVGLAYFAHKDYQNALKHAQKAYSMDYPLPGLKNKLIEVGKWVAPTGEKATPDSPSGQPTEQTSDRTVTAAKPAE